MQAGRIDIITMGCSKNLVDSERLMRRLEAKGYEMHHDSHDVCGEFVVINTCGFIGDAKEESIDMILQIARAKEDGRVGRIAVMGCLPERYIDELRQEIPEVDEWYGKYDWNRIVSNLPDRNTSGAGEPELWERVLTGAPYSAYLKISEGCDRFCAYCAIPIITGRHHSRPVDEIVEEVRSLVGKGVTEFNVIAQDLSAYGTDIGYTNREDGTRSGLATLVDAIADIPGVRWIRLHYAYPVDFPWDVLEVMRRRQNVCDYLDIALQHISTPVLTAMRRHIDKDATMRLIERIRREAPGIRLRTTLMTGFPGEGEAEFAELVDFVREARFDRMGAFAYCEEDGTYAQKHYDDDVPVEIKERRKQKILEIQEAISAELNQKLVGRDLLMLIDRIEGDEAVGRSQWDSPEVDNEIRLSLPEGYAMPAPGTYIKVKITEADAFDLRAEITD